MRKLLVTFGFFLITPFFILFTAAFYSFLNVSKTNPHPILFSASPNKTLAYAALPITQEIGSAQIVQEDARVEIVRQFFARYGSRLEPFAQDVVSAADQYGIDFRYIPAIAM